MKVVFVDGPQPERIDHPSVFLAGPTPRSPEVQSWRPEAIRLFEERNFNGTLYVPERRDWQARFDYYDQVEWEFKYLEGASMILFWVPRDMDTMPALTTNVEFGRYVDSGRCSYGRPHCAEKVRYLDWLYDKMTGRLPAESLKELVDDTLIAVWKRQNGSRQTGI